MIINWSSQYLERIFSGLSRIRKQTASKSYLEYRRNLLPYAIWVQNNLPLKKLENLITTYTHYIEEVEQGAEHSKTQGKPLKPPIWWKELRQQSNREDLVSILRTMPERYYSSWSLKPIKAYVEGMRNLNSYPSSNIFYNAIWQEIGPLTLLFWAQDKDWGYHTYTKKLWKTLPWRIRFKIMAVNLRLERVESTLWDKDYEWQYKDFQSVYDKFVKKFHGSNPHPGIPSFAETRDFFRGFFQAYQNQMHTEQRQYEENQKDYNAYRSFTPEVRMFLLEGLIDLDKALQIGQAIRESQPEIQFDSRKSSLPQGWDFTKFNKLAKELGFDPELPTFDLIVCPTCNGEGGTTTGKPNVSNPTKAQDTIRVCSKCSGIGLLDVNQELDPEYVIPKLYYPSQEVSSGKKRRDLAQRLGTLLNQGHKMEARKVAHLRKEIAEGITILSSLTPNYK